MKVKCPMFNSISKTALFFEYQKLTQDYLTKTLKYFSTFFPQIHLK